MNKIIDAITLLLVILATACNSFLTQEPETVPTNINYWKNEKDVESATYGLHVLFRNTFGDYSQHYRDRGCILDFINSAQWRKACENDLSGITPTSSIITWTEEYQTIAQANLIIDNIHRAELSAERHNFYLGQALTIRAYAYFTLTRTWENVPLILTSEDVTVKAQTPGREVANAIIADLTKAVTLLPPANELKDSKGAFITNKQIPSRGTANAILAHVYAWIAGFYGESTLYEQSIKAASEVISDPNYTLADNPEQVCEVVMHGNSSEGIFEVVYSETAGEFKTYGSYIAGAVQRWPIQPKTTQATKRTYRLNFNTVFSLYSDPDDLRRTAYFCDLIETSKLPVSTTQNAAYIQKWRHPVMYNDGIMQGMMKTYDENEILIRLADIILLRAEIRAKSGNEPGAIADLNRIRERANCNPYSSADGDLRKAIQQERDKELLLEGFSTRYFDNIRNLTYRENLKGAFKTLTDRNALFLPYAFSSFVNNPNLKQNPYWAAHGFSH